MPINPNIALGAQNQVQPINMLGQMGQLYALKAAKQEFEGGEALRDAFASGGDLNDPAFIQRLRAANPKMALDIEAKHLAGQKTRSELEAAAYKNTREALTMVNNPESLRAFSLSQFNDPVIGPRLKAIGLTPEVALANLDKEIATSGFETALKKASMGLDSFFKDQTSRRNTDVSSGAAYGQLALAQKKFDLEQRQQDEVNKILRGEAPAAAPVSTGGPTAATPVGAGSVPTGASAPTAAPATAPTNALAPTGASAAPTNALVAPKGDVYSEIARLDAQIRQLAGSGNPKALEAARVLNSQRNALLQSAQQQYGGQLVDMQVADPANPGKTITIKGRTDQYGRVMPAEMGAVPLSVDASATGGTTISPSVVRAPLTAGQERQVETARVKEEGQKTVNTVLGTLYQQYSGLVNQGGITDTSKSVAANLKASAGSNIIGQTVSGAVGGKAQEFRDSIEQTRPLLLNAIKNATGMSAQQLNSNVELQTYLKAATDPKLSIQANIKAMNNISTLFGLGEEFKIPVPEKKSSAPSSGGVALPKGFKLDD